MLDFNKLKNNLKIYQKLLKFRGIQLNTKFITIILNNLKLLQLIIQRLQTKRNRINQNLKQQHNNLNTPLFLELSNQVKKINNKLKNLKPKLNILKNKLNKYLLTLPNIPDKSLITYVLDNTNNVCLNKEIYKWGIPKIFNFNLKNHIELGLNNNFLDFKGAVKLTKSNFVIINGKLAKLYRILSQFMLDTHINVHHYYEVYVPYIINQSSLLATGQLPKFKDELFYVVDNINSNTQHNKYALIPTAEVPLVNIFRNKILNKQDLPLKLVSNTPCFRVEAGSYGKISRGLTRLHQFDKVELVQITDDSYSMQALEEITNHAENILRLLNLPYRKVLLSSYDMNFCASKSYDLEVWIPSLNNYLEVSSCSNTTDFQARRLKSKYKHNNQLKYVHILNASGLAVGRTLIAIMENYQTANGNILIPKVLQPYMKQNKLILNNNF